MTRSAPPPAEATAIDRPWLRFVLPLLALSMLIAGLGSVGYRYLSEEIRRETHRTLAVIVEQKRQQIEGWLPAADLAVNLALDGAGRLLTVTALTPRGTACLSTLTPPAAA